MTLNPIKTEEQKTFFRQLFVLVGPICLQNLLSAAVSSADVVMLNFVGQTAIAAVNLASYVQFILFIFYIGLSSGLVILCAQYWGKKDTHSIETIFGFALKISLAVAFIFSAASIFIPEYVMRIFTDDLNMINVGAEYLKIVGWSYLILAFSQTFQAVLKSIEKVKIVTICTVTALSLNIVLNAVFIFGLFGCPKMGVKGVALATTIARIIEVVISVAAVIHVKEIKLRLECLFRKNKILFKDFMHISLPALGNEAVWGTGFTMYSVIMGHLGEDIVAANAVVQVLRNLASVACFGLAYGGAILIGKQLGSNQLDLAKRNAARLIKVTVLAGIFGGILMIIGEPLLYRFADLKSSAQEYLKWFCVINAFSLLGSAINTVFICGVFRAGGDAKFGFIMDTIAMWVVSVPLGFLSAFVFKFPPMVVYAIMFLDEYEKMIFVYLHYRSGKWVKNITRDFE